MIKRVWKLLLIVLVSVFMLPSSMYQLHAEGSKDLSEDGGFRPYTERY